MYKYDKSGKKIMLKSFRDVKENYMYNMYAQTTDSPKLNNLWKILLAILAILVIILIVVYFLRKNKK